jgi:hypothetical protein
MCVVWMRYQGAYAAKEQQRYGMGGRVFKES